MSGKKFDQEKPDMSLLSPFALEEIAKVMTYGKQKYGANNWRNGLAFSRLIAAVMRHLNAYQKGQMVDPETGLSHLAHASCGLLMLLEFEIIKPELNDLYHCKKETFKNALDNLSKEINNQQLEFTFDERDSLPKICPVVDTYKPYKPKMQP